MSRLNLLTCVTARAAFVLKNQKHCMSTGLLTSSSGRKSFTTNDHTNNYNNFLTTRNKSSCAIPISILQPFHSLKRCSYETINQLRYPAVCSTATFRYSLKQNFATKSAPDNAGKTETKSSAATIEADIFGDASKLGLFAKFKLMYKKYWYVLIPVHVVTSIGWLGAFYYMSKSGVDVPSVLQYMHLSETIIQKVQNSDMGHIAIAYLCYKVATPVRYAVTLGGTTVSIKYLVQMGYIKPMPSKDEFIQMYEQKKADRAAAKAEKENVTTGPKK